MARAGLFLRMSPRAAPVLLIDDNPDDLFLTEDLLKKSGVAGPIVTVNGGEEAIELLGKYSAGGAKWKFLN